MARPCGPVSAVTSDVRQGSEGSIGTSSAGRRFLELSGRMMPRNRQQRGGVSAMTHDRGRDLPVLDEGVLQDLKDGAGGRGPDVAAVQANAQIRDVIREGSRHGYLPPKHANTHTEGPSNSRVPACRRSPAPALAPRHDPRLGSAPGSSSPGDRMPWVRTTRAASGESSTREPARRSAPQGNDRDQPRPGGPASRRGCTHVHRKRRLDILQ